MSAFRPDAEQHGEYRRWLQAREAGAEPFAVSDLVFAGFLRVVTRPRIFAAPDSLAAAT